MRSTVERWEPLRGLRERSCLSWFQKEGRKTRSALGCLAGCYFASCHMVWSFLGQLNPQGLLFASNTCCRKLKTYGKLQGGRNPCSDFPECCAELWVANWHGREQGRWRFQPVTRRELAAPAKGARTLLSGSQGPLWGPMGTVCRGCRQWDQCS